ncbi:hypothetical protein CSOJ01_06756 [Colletotrichum sojae]|uniref:Uncharacterized protein n=1 Tax=Colletotrichum sojae TaxID=2175907 RepID=A0A8H6MVJ3_9PEZI|nr:hypothetical protein CSOJ01_06756 [Colletotrichum sojae]
MSSTKDEAPGGRRPSSVRGGSLMDAKLKGSPLRAEQKLQQSIIVSLETPDRTPGHSADESTEQRDPVRP